MVREAFTMAAVAAMAAAVAACGGGDEAAPAPKESETPATANSAAAGDLTEMPPMVVRSPAYRCDDGRALYVDVLSDENAVNVRDSRKDLPTRLEREGGTGAFTAENRSLSGTGDEVRYSAPDRPAQGCRAAAG